MTVCGCGESLSSEIKIKLKNTIFILMDHYLFQNREAQKELLASNDDLSDNNITKVSDLKKKKKTTSMANLFICNFY